MIDPRLIEDPRERWVKAELERISRPSEPFPWRKFFEIIPLVCGLINAAIVYLFIIAFDVE